MNGWGAGFSAIQFEPKRNDGSASEPSCHGQDERVMGHRPVFLMGGVGYSWHCPRHANFHCFLHAGRDSGGAVRITRHPAG